MPPNRRITAALPGLLPSAAVAATGGMGAQDLITDTVRNFAAYRKVRKLLQDDGVSSSERRNGHNTTRGIASLLPLLHAVVVWSSILRRALRRSQTASWQESDDGEFVWCLMIHVLCAAASGGGVVLLFHGQSGVVSAAAV